MELKQIKVDLELLADFAKVYDETNEIIEGAEFFQMFILTILDKTLSDEELEKYFPYLD